YGLQNEAAQVLRSIDAEEFNQRTLTANRTFDAAVEACRRQQYAQAVTMLQSIDSHLLPPEKQVRLKEMMLMPGMQPGALVQAGQREALSAERGNAGAQPGKAVATDGRSALSASRSTTPETDFAHQVEAMQEVKFQKLR